MPTGRSDPLLPLLEAEYERYQVDQGEAPTVRVDTHACTTNNHAEAAGSRMCAFVAATRPGFAGSENRLTACTSVGDVARFWICYAGLDSVVAGISEQSFTNTP